MPQRGGLRRPRKLHRQLREVSGIRGQYGLMGSRRAHGPPGNPPGGHRPGLPGRSAGPGLDVRAGWVHDAEGYRGLAVSRAGRLAASTADSWHYPAGAGQCRSSLI